MVQFFLRNSQPNGYLEMGHFGFFQLSKNYAEATLLIDEKYKSQEASYRGQQSSGKIQNS